ncbi:hypothetical protein Cgig2_025675 [Carnegiea gigantea]|uniref:Uncharacterized protein n=1 Tax=Carnegiea gigantea TaxID=171969 RepID=A0A9Q1Q6Q8_9CARY|nr:hypothetical protein Cgig2_025675 [Carnegiea gigantea]
MAMASARFFALFPLALHSPLSSLHLFSRHAIRPSPHLILSPPISPSRLLPSLRSSHLSSLHSQSQPLKWGVTPPSFPESHGASDSSGAYHSWPEWLEFVNCVSSSGYCSRSVDASEFVGELNTEFLRIANGCLHFARDYPDVLSLPREDVKVVVDDGTQFLFKDALTIRRRMKSFLACGLNDVGLVFVLFFLSFHSLVWVMVVVTLFFGSLPCAFLLHLAEV